MDRLRRLEIFVKVADAGSLARAARILLVTPSAVSHAITELESEVGTRLLYRTTRQLRLSAEGAEVLRQARSVLCEMERLDTLAFRQKDRVTGRLRVGMPSGVARHVLLPHLPEFTHGHPDLEIEMINSGSVTDMHVSGADLNFRIGPVADSELVARPLACLRFGVYAAPAYLARHGTPQHPRDLPGHRTLLHKPSRSLTIAPWDQWTYEGGGEKGVARVRHHVVTDDREALLVAALAGAGLFRMGMFSPQLLSSGQLVRVLGQWEWTGGPELSMLYRRGARLPRRITAFMDFAVEAVRRFDPLGATLQSR
jgi:LysR family transcriptional regulator for bpeEF and oprC